MAEDFEDIRRVDVAREKVRKMSRGTWYQVPFVLSERPPGDWTKILVQEWHDRVRTDMYEMEVRGDEAIVTCPVEEVPRQLQYLKDFCRVANDRYRASLEREAEQVERLREKGEKDRERVERLLGDLQIRLSCGARWAIFGSGPV